MPLRTVDLTDEMNDKLKQYADEHEIYKGNVSSVIREALLVFFHEKDKGTSKKY